MAETTTPSVDTEVRRAFDWFLSYLPPGEWHRRKAAIESYLNSVCEPRQQSIYQAHPLEPISIQDDRIAWYLYLAETTLTEPYKTEPSQAARVLPIFARLGAHLDLLKNIGGVAPKVQELLNAAKANPDSILFELLIALLWAKNGWPSVELLSADSTQKRLDIKANSGADEWYIEAKRLTKTSAYSEKERQKWLAMWRHLKDVLVTNRLPFVLDVVFHVELESLPDTFLRDQLEGKFRFVTAPCQLIDNEVWTLSVDFVDFDAAERHFEDNYVKCPSEQLNQLIAGRRDANRGFTAVYCGKIVRIGEGDVNNQYLESLVFAAGALWSCDAERAFECKARDIRARLADAVAQLPDNGKGVVHVGIETLDGQLVEFERYRRIVNTVSSFDARGKDLRWIHCHLLQAYAPPDKAWVLDETVYNFGLDPSAPQEPLSDKAAISEAEFPDEDQVHWLKEAP